jgi:hypothetical protein
MPQCAATCKDGGACRHNAKPGMSVCGKHTDQAKPIPVKTVYVILCGKVTSNGTKCKCPREKGAKLCKRHHNAEQKKERRRQLREIWGSGLQFLWDFANPPELFPVFINERLDQIAATVTERERMGQLVINELDFYYVMHPAVGHGVDPPRTELEGLARDAQNVHTPAVNKQTQEAVTALLETQVAVDQDTLVELQGAWRTHPKASRKSVLKDVARWYQTKTCRVDNDYLYQRLLDGLWTRIKLSPHKDDLVQRLWEECVESLQVCCEGHISRLCNVLVGYDETFKAPISAGEMLQQRIAAIAGEDISLPHKVVKAWEVMEELQIPREQRMEWIEAF